MEILLNIPDEFNYSEQELKMILGVSLYEKNILGSNECAKAVGMDYLTFIKQMGKYGESVLDLPKEELERDAINAKEFII